MSRLALLAGLVAAIACGGSSSSTAPQSSLLNGRFTASINGAAWTATGRVSVTPSDAHSLIIQGSSPTYIITLDLLNAVAVGVYNLPGDSLLASFANGTNFSAGASWSTSLTGGSGSVSLTTLTSSRVAGTFSFVAFPPTGSKAGTLNVASGSFDVTY
jgi:uncharacterized protein DUF6252